MRVPNSTRTEAIAKLERGLQSLDEHIQTMESRVASAKDSARASAQKMMEDLKSRRDRFATRLRDAKDAGAEAWDEIHSGLNRAWGEIETALQDARGKLN
jgi:predicted  nucleic acid-binding Zn-ribbon protein